MEPRMNADERGWEEEPQLLMPLEWHPEMMKIGHCLGTLEWPGLGRNGDRFSQWCRKPAPQFDPDIATNPRLLPSPGGEHAGQIVRTCDVLRPKAVG